MEQDPASILLTCLEYTSPADKAERLAPVSAEDWRRVAELAQQHGVAQLLYHLTKSMNTTIPVELAGELKQKYLHNALRNMGLYQDLRKLLNLFQEKDIPVITLKGAYLAEAVYGNIALRTMSDVDLLVKENDLPRVEQELLALGCVPMDSNRLITQDNHHFGYQLPESGLHLEIHWILFTCKKPFQVDADGLWNRSQPVTLARTTARVLGPEDLLLHLCQHTAKHTYEMRMRMLCDIGELVRQRESELNWQRIGTRAREWGTLRSLYVILRLAQELLAVPVPADWLASLRPDRFEEGYFALARQRILAGGTVNSMANLKTVAQLWKPIGLGSKLELIRQRLLPPRETLSLAYPAPANSWRIFLYYPMHWKDVLARRGAAFWQLARGNPKALDLAQHTNQVTRLRDWLISK